MPSITPNRYAVPSILMVDDVPDNLRLLTGILSSRGYKVRPVSSGALALKAIQKAPPELILLDISMSELDGYQICQRLKSDPRFAEIPVIFLSALNETDAKLKAFQNGGADYITKPFHPEEVLARVENQLKIRRLQQSVEKRNQELAEANRSLREVDALRENLVQMIVHDMRSPLAAQMGFLNILSTKAAPLLEEEDLVCLVGAMQTSGRLINMVNSLLDVSRLESGRVPMHRTQNDLKKIGQDAMKLYRPLLERRQLIMTQPGKPEEVECDAYLVQRVFENLIGNALRFTEPTGFIRIAITSSEREVRIRVADNGVGIAPENRAVIFQKFGQVRSSRNKNSSGLGLAFCKLAVEAHGGSIGFESEPGKGSTFWFTLPKKQAAAALV